MVMMPGAADPAGGWRAEEREGWALTAPQYPALTTGNRSRRKLALLGAFGLPGQVVRLTTENAAPSFGLSGGKTEHGATCADGSSFAGWTSDGGGCRNAAPPRTERAVKKTAASGPASGRPCEDDLPAIFPVFSSGSAAHVAALVSWMQVWLADDENLLFWETAAQAAALPPAGAATQSAAGKRAAVIELQLQLAAADAPSALARRWTSALTRHLEEVALPFLGTPPPTSTGIVDDFDSAGHHERPSAAWARNAGVAHLPAVDLGPSPTLGCGGVLATADVPAGSELVSVAEEAAMNFYAALRDPDFRPLAGRVILALYGHRMSPAGVEEGTAVDDGSDLSSKQSGNCLSLSLDSAECDFLLCLYLIWSRHHLKAATPLSGSCHKGGRSADQSKDAGKRFGRDYEKAVFGTHASDIQSTTWMEGAANSAGRSIESVGTARRAREAYLQQISTDASDEYALNLMMAPPEVLDYLNIPQVSKFVASLTKELFAMFEHFHAMMADDVEFDTEIFMNWEDLLWARTILDTRGFAPEVAAPAVDEDFDVLQLRREECGERHWLRSRRFDASGADAAAGPDAAAAACVAADGAVAIQLVVPSNLTCLLPFIDMFNHHPVGHCRPPKYDRQTRRYRVRTEVGVRGGNEIFLSYGPCETWQLLLYYGFCPAAARGLTDDMATAGGDPLPDDPAAGGCPSTSGGFSALSCRGSAILTSFPNLDVLRAEIGGATLLLRSAAAGAANAPAVAATAGLSSGLREQVILNLFTEAVERVQELQSWQAQMENGKDVAVEAARSERSEEERKREDVASAKMRVAGGTDASGTIGVPFWFPAWGERVLAYFTARRDLVASVWLSG